jgi:hypothetical protein
VTVALLLAAVFPVNGQTTESPGVSWDRRYDGPMYVYGKEPVDFLRQIVPQLRVGQALVQLLHPAEFLTGAAGDEPFRTEESTVARGTQPIAPRLRRVAHPLL